VKESEYLRHLGVGAVYEYERGVLVTNAEASKFANVQWPVCVLAGNATAKDIYMEQLDALYQITKERVYI
jgi:hypothetical protein